MTNTAIARVEALAFNEDQPPIQASGLVAEWRHNQVCDESTYDLDYQQPPLDAPHDLFDADDCDDVANDEVADLFADGPLPFLQADLGAADAARGAFLGENESNMHDVLDNAADNNNVQGGAPEEAAIFHV